MKAGEEYFLISLSKDVLQEMIEKAVQRSLEALKPTPEEKLLSSKEVCEFLKISAPTLNKWASEGRVNKHRIASRVFFKQSEINSALTTLEKYKQS